MKMKEKKAEEVVEETPKVSDELMEYLEFVRYCVHQNAIFRDFNGDLKQKDMILESLGLDISKPVTVASGFSKESISNDYDGFIQNWIDRYNELDLTKVDNYTVARLQILIPNICDLVYKEHIKKCAQHTTEE